MARGTWGVASTGVAGVFFALEGESFGSEAEFQRAVIAAFNARLREFPPHYSYLDAICWAVRQGWILVEGAEISVSLADAIPAPPVALALAA